MNEQSSKSEATRPVQQHETGTCFFGRCYACILDEAEAGRRAGRIISALQCPQVTQQYLLTFRASRVLPELLTPIKTTNPANRHIADFKRIMERKKGAGIDANSCCPNEDRMMMRRNKLSSHASFPPSFCNRREMQLSRLQKSGR